MESNAATAVVDGPSGFPCRRAGKGSIPPERLSPGSGLSLALVGTYPPAKCGIATFNLALAHALRQPPSHSRVGVVSSVDSAGERHPPEVVAQLVRGSRASARAAAVELGAFDVVVVQHEFGIYGGLDGAEIVDLVDQLSAPVIVVLHTVLEHPSSSQRAIIERLARGAGFVVAQSVAAQSRFLTTYGVSPDRLRVIPHGASLNLSAPLPSRGPRRRPVVLTWGLIGPAKGIEFAVEALAQLRDLDPWPRYIVLGETHPRVLAAEGEVYRESLIAKVRALEIEDLVEFRDVYLKPRSVLAAIRAADVVLLPYLARDQVVSGVLVEAIASGKPVVATRFPHAVEMLSEGSGILVPHEDHAAIAAALRSLLTDHALASRMAEVARRQAPPLAWHTVAAAYLGLARALVCSAAQVER